MLCASGAVQTGWPERLRQLPRSGPEKCPSVQLRLMSGALTLKTASVSRRSLVPPFESLRVLSSSDTDDAKKRPAHRIC
jgi:hypothetical protein